MNRLCELLFFSIIRPVTNNLLLFIESRSIFFFVGLVLFSKSVYIFINL